jgi:hypothetical protein
MRRFWLHMLIRVVGIGVMLMLLPVLVRAHGLSGAAAAILLSSIAMSLLYTVAIVILLRMFTTRSYRTAATSIANLEEVLK